MIDIPFDTDQPRPEIEVGEKHDQGKYSPIQIFKYMPQALIEVSKVATFGAIKYKPGSFMQVPDAHDRYTDALYRHLLEEHVQKINGIIYPVDDESDCLISAHAAWNALARLQIEIVTKGR